MLPLLASLAIGLTPSGSILAAHAVTTAQNPVPSPGSSVRIWHGAQDKSNSGATCANYTFPVSLQAGQPKKYHLFGSLCHQGAVAGKTIEILLNGGTYDSTYWDFPYEPQKYSYVKWATAAGYVTLNLDRLGYGYSSHADPLGDSFTVQGWTVHQVVQEVRAGELGAQFYRIVLVGHSIGTFTAWDEAGTYHDVDAVIITGAEHTANLVKLSEVIAVHPGARTAGSEFRESSARVLYYLSRSALPDTVLCAQHQPTCLRCQQRPRRAAVSTAEIADIAPIILDTAL